MSLESFIAARYLKSNRTSRPLAFLTVIALAAVFISVFCFLVIHAVMNGFSTHLREALIGFDDHLIISSAGDDDNRKSLSIFLSGEKEVREFQEVVDLVGIVIPPDGGPVGAKIRGMDWASLTSGKKGRIQPLFFSEPGLDEKNGNIPPVLAGSELYSRLHLYPGQLEEISIVYPFGDVGPTGEVEPRSRAFRIVGVFSTGFYGVDSQYLLMNRSEAEWLSGFDPGRHQFLVRLKHLRQAPRFGVEVKKNFSWVTTETWIEKNRRLFEALKLEKGGMVLLLGMVSLIATLNIFALVVLLLSKKSGEISLLRVLGMDLSRIKIIFLLSGFFLGGGGALAGFVSGMGILWWMGHHPMPLPSAYYLDFLPILMDPRWAVAALILAPCFALVASLMPAWMAAKINPRESL